MSSKTRQIIVLYRVQHRVEIDTLNYSILFLVFLSCCHAVGAYEIRILEISWEINLYHFVRIHNNNSDCKVFN